MFNIVEIVLLLVEPIIFFISYESCMAATMTVME
jgi:hypothetical protein